MPVKLLFDFAVIFFFSGICQCDHFAAGSEIILCKIRILVILYPGPGSHRVDFWILDQDFEGSALRAVSQMGGERRKCLYSSQELFPRMRAGVDPGREKQAAQRGCGTSLSFHDF